VFDALHRRHKAADAMLYAFDPGRAKRQESSAAPGDAAGGDVVIVELRRPRQELDAMRLLNGWLPQPIKFSANGRCSLFNWCSHLAKCGRYSWWHRLSRVRRGSVMKSSLCIFSVSSFMLSFSLTSMVMAAMAG
jgi:hypothetical protein